MRKILLIAAAGAALLPLPATAQTRTSTPPPALTLNAAQRAELQTAVARGRALAVLDQASRVSTQDMLARVPNAREAGIVGWIGVPEGNGVTVTYYGRDGDNYVAIYRGQVLGNRVSAPQVFEGANRPRLDGVAARMAAARAAAVATGHTACGPDFNTLVLPPQDGQPTYVYQLSPRMAADKVPGGGHFRIAVAADGTLAENVAIAGACRDIAVVAPVAGQRVRPLQVTAPEGQALPNELPVFLSLWTQRPVVVAAGDPVRLWGVTGEGIAELRQ